MQKVANKVMLDVQQLEGPDNVVTLYMREQPDELDDGTQTADSVPAAESISSTSMAALSDKVNEINLEPPIEMKSKIQAEIREIIKNKKVFAINKTHPMYKYQIVQFELLQRGWVEKQINENYRTQNKLFYAKYLPEMLRHEKPNLIWTNYSFNKAFYSDFPLHSKMIHRPVELDFASKLGLCYLRPTLHWHKEDKAPDMILPRAYAMGDAAERQAFADDFRLTLCASFLFELMKLNLKEMFTPNGFHSPDIVNFAVRYVRNSVHEKRNKNIDDLDEASQLQPELFEAYDKEFKRIVKNNETIKVNGEKAAELLISQIHSVMNDATHYFPHLMSDGSNDLWIIKPASCRFGCGYGITVYNSEIEICKHCDRFSNTLFIVQKYLERPLLVHNTKFDIRQYFLVSMDDKDMNIWMYKNCYLKFSSQEYSLQNLSRSVHITNHTVQKYFKNGNRSPDLPQHNMWVLEEFKNYLSSIGFGEIWDKQIYPELVESLKAIFRGTIEGIEFAQNNFHLFGADVMITYDFHPVILEINSGPDLRNSTISTKQVCTALIRDLVKVVVDYRDNKKCSTGDFEKIYSVGFANCCPTSDPKFEVVGTSCKVFPASEFKTVKITVKPSYNSSSASSSSSNSQNSKTLSKQSVFVVSHASPVIVEETTASPKRNAQPLSRTTRIKHAYSSLNTSFTDTNGEVVKRKIHFMGKKTAKKAIVTLQDPRYKELPFLKKIDTKTFILRPSKIIHDYIRSKDKAAEVVI